MKKKEKNPAAKDLYKQKKDDLENRLGLVQRQAAQAKVPVIVVFEGYEGAGQGKLISKLVPALDDNSFKVFTFGAPDKAESRHPFLWRYWRKLPKEGQIGIFSGSWYRQAGIAPVEGGVKEKDLPAVFDSIRSFETQLIAGGYVLIKIFLSISQKEQGRRFEKALSQKVVGVKSQTAYKQINQDYPKYQSRFQEMIAKSSHEAAPWLQVDGTQWQEAALIIQEHIITTIGNGVKKARKKQQPKAKPAAKAAKKASAPPKTPLLDQADLNLDCGAKTYDKKIKELKDKLEVLQGRMERAGLPVIICFEGWDASGKSGTIKQLTSQWDPAAYVIHHTEGADDFEKAHHYLWRFWSKVPREGHTAIFDRSWYGRVLVERVEGLASSVQWRAAYGEINDFERDLTQAGALLLKFWFHIDPKTQLARFQAREADPAKQWKMKPEDWEARKKWNDYALAVEEMLQKTHTEAAPWQVIPANSKYHARLQVLEAIIEAVEKAIP